ncbi:MAG: type II secretion system F family protein [Trinickia sp.]|jgi:tight adherence protein C|uniref:type II secretion system F family protein n=1 Tax=Trinickia sp. TaxID=2571163 RepID=UPI003F7F082A
MDSPNTTNIVLLVGLFVIVFAGAFGAMLIFAPRDMRRRIQQAGGPQVSLPSEAESTGAAWLEKIADISEPIAKLSIPKENWDKSALRLQLMNAGWRSPHAAAVYFAAKTALALALPLLALPWLATSSISTNPMEMSGILLLLGAIGNYLPNGVLKHHVTTRKRAIFEDFPDAIDLLTVCVEAGLGLDAAMVKVADEIKLRSPVVASELQLMLLELRSGFSKEQALRNLSLRTGVDDIESFSTMLIQAERFGTSIGDSLRVLSDTLRTRRQMRAEEQAAKIALKLLLPLCFCIFPAMFIVLLGPAVIQVYRVLLPILNGGGI